MILAEKRDNPYLIYDMESWTTANKKFKSALVTRGQAFEEAKAHPFAS
jgi:hypothetical protein